jgi:hypothetical protein
MLYGTSNGEFLDINEGFLLRSLIPNKIVNNYSYLPTTKGKTCCFHSNLLSYAIHDFGSIPKSYSTLMEKIIKGNSRYSIIGSWDKKQFCGATKDGKQYHGIVYDKYRNYRTFSDQIYYTGEIFSLASQVKYCGQIYKNLPNGFGQLWLAGKLAYMGNFVGGECTGNGYIFDEKEKIKFFGNMRDGIPAEGVFINKKSVFEGEIWENVVESLDGPGKDEAQHDFGHVFQD